MYTYLFLTAQLPHFFVKLKDNKTLKKLNILQYSSIFGLDFAFLSIKQTCNRNLHTNELRYEQARYFF